MLQRHLKKVLVVTLCNRHGYQLVQVHYYHGC